MRKKTQAQSFCNSVLTPVLESLVLFQIYAESRAMTVNDLLDDLLEVVFAVFADRADVIFWQLLAFIFVAADDTTPDGFALGGLAYRLGFRHDMRLIVIVGGRRHIGKHFHLGDRADEEHVGSEIDNLLHADGDVGIGAARDSQCAVRNTAALLEVGELVNRAPALETEMLE